MIWHHEERLAEWFQALRQRRQEKMNGGSDEWEPIPPSDEDFVTNELIPEHFRR